MSPRLTSIPFVLAACVSWAWPADAAPRDRVFVASYGTDTNNTTCSFTQPCRTFQNALSNVAAGGEVTAIDSAGFGPVTINQAVTITSPNGVEAGITATANGAAVLIQAGLSDVVSLHGLALEGAGIASYGVNIFTVGKVEIADCTIRDFGTSGINSASPDEVLLTVSNTYLSNNNYGVNLLPAGGSSITATFDHVLASANGYGMSLAAGNGPLEATITNSDFSNNSAPALSIGGQASSNQLTTVNVINTAFNNNPTAIALGSFSTVTLSHVNDVLSTSGVDFTSNTSVTVFSDGTNHVSVTGGGSLSAYPFK